jgi:hypothetical protein
MADGAVRLILGRGVFGESQTPGIAAERKLCLSLRQPYLQPCRCKRNIRLLSARITVIHAHGNFGVEKLAREKTEWFLQTRG